VEDGSSPAIGFGCSESKPRCILIRLEGCERLAARNVGARTARGAVVVLVDDDMSVATDCLESHLAAQREWPDALGRGIDLCVGGGARATLRALPAGALDARSTAEQGESVREELLHGCQHGNAPETIPGTRGFDEALVTAEDQGEGASVGGAGSARDDCGV